QVMVTYDEFGQYGHPDHVQAHRVATYAASLAAVPSYRRDLGEPWEITKIYWGAISESRLREGLRRLRAAGNTTAFEGMEPDGDLPPMFCKDEDIACEVDGSAYVQQKVAALRAHPTQINPEGGFFSLNDELGAEALAIEHFRIAKGNLGPVGENGWESDLFAGIDPD
ncbi:MAG TPA: N-acetyl-1-D-myo-inositol-2-amino-2-deoxy-alpha-D-glucopyranoside deacetylase, partial [Nocardioides sp.]|nr:N-acetyl-1-D-myo-inositol-2-amino-2-deoxy-alpha-D-glucopyranoside deacetylase [Nocardioides sp.]